MQSSMVRQKKRRSTLRVPAEAPRKTSTLLLVSSGQHTANETSYSLDPIYEKKIISVPLFLGKLPRLPFHHKLLFAFSQTAHTQSTRKCPPTHTHKVCLEMGSRPKKGREDLTLASGPVTNPPVSELKECAKKPKRNLLISP